MALACGSSSCANRAVAVAMRRDDTCARVELLVHLHQHVQRRAGKRFLDACSIARTCTPWPTRAPVKNKRLGIVDSAAQCPEVNNVKAAVCTVVCRNLLATGMKVLEHDMEQNTGSRRACRCASYECSLTYGI
jgi:hypothetical protein